MNELTYSTRPAETRKGAEKRLFQSMKSVDEQGNERARSN